MNLPEVTVIYIFLLSSAVSTCETMVFWLLEFSSVLSTSSSCISKKINKLAINCEAAPGKKSKVHDILAGHNQKTANNFSALKITQDPRGRKLIF